MTILIVQNGFLICGEQRFRCAIGKNGYSADKKEGDGATPVGTFALRECWYRADRVAMPQTELPLQIIYENDGWSDDATAADYNQHVTLPYDFSHENLWRDDHVYDLIVPLGYNDDPVVAGKGSAIFMHIAKPASAALERDNIYAGTEGCVALAEADLVEVLKLCDSGTTIEIRGN